MEMKPESLFQRLDFLFFEDDTLAEDFVEFLVLHFASNGLAVLARKVRRTGFFVHEFDEFLF